MTMNAELAIKTTLEHAILREALEQIEFRYRNAAKFGVDGATQKECQTFAKTATALLSRLVNEV